MIFLTLGINCSNISANTLNNAEYSDLEKRINLKFNDYILGPGDKISIEIKEIIELSGNYQIDSNGLIFLPRLKYANVKGLTLGELEELLTKSYKKYIKEPDIEIRILEKRPVKVMVKGEVLRPGLYTLFYKSPSSMLEQRVSSSSNRNQTTVSQLLFPTVFEAIQKANGITTNADLSAIKIIRLTPDSKGGELITTEVDFINLLNFGDQNQNIPLNDGDLIIVKKSKMSTLEQVKNAGANNLNPEFIRVYLSGSFREKKEAIELPQGITLSQAISVAGGLEIFSSNKIEFIRFKNDGNVERRLISLSKIEKKANNRDNPILRNGDIIRAKPNSLGYATEAIDKIGTPFLSVFTILNIFDN